jgi:hypothetical protein
MCRKKKIKCDGKLPACTHCINYKTECVFTQVEKKRNPPKGYGTVRQYERTGTNMTEVPNTSKVSRIGLDEWRISCVCQVCVISFIDRLIRSQERVTDLNRRAIE